MFPFRDHNPSGRTPYVTYTLIALNVLIFLSYWAELNNARYMNTLLLDRLDHAVTDVWLRGHDATDSVWAIVARLLARSILSVWVVVVMVVAVRALAAYAGFLPAALLGFDGPRGLAFFLTPGGTLVVLGLVLALIRVLGGLEETDE